MSVISRLPSLGGLRAITRVPAAHTTLQRWMGGGPRTMNITASRWQWHKFKDLLHFYFMLGAIPSVAIAFATSVFIGPAELAPIPEGYEPKHWEYHAHPISRFLARYMYCSHQQDYEKMLHYLYEENEMKEMRLLERKVKEVMSSRLDSQATYYRPILTKYHKWVREEYQKVTEKGF